MDIDTTIGGWCNPTDCRKNKNFTHRLGIACVTFTIDYKYEFIQIPHHHVIKSNTRINLNLFVFN